MFGKSTRGKRLKSADRISGNLPFVTAGETDEGVSDFIGNDVTVFSKNTITIDMFGSAKYRSYEYGCDDHVAVVHTNKLPKSASIFITSAIHKSSYNGQFNYGRNFYAKDADDLRIQLPIKNSKPDFEFMENYVSCLEAERLQKLEVYLQSSGIENYVLTENEQKAFNEYQNIQWREFKIGDLFERVTSKKLPFKAEELPKEMTENYTLPCLTSSFKNQGLNYFVPKDEATILQNVISIPSNSDIYRSYFQSNEFTILSDAYAVRWILDDVKLLPNQYLFAVQCINKVTDLPIYSYKNKLGGWNVVKNKYIQLPTKNDKPDYELMTTLISAMKKLTIKNVVLYLESKQETIKAV